MQYVQKSDKLRYCKSTRMFWNPLYSGKKFIWLSCCLTYFLTWLSCYLTHW